MRNAVSAALVVAALAAPAFAHGGAYVNPPSGGGPQAVPGFGEPGEGSGGPVTRWESWWADNREDLLKIAEHLDASQQIVVTPADGEGPSLPDPAKVRATIAAKVRADVFPHLLWALSEEDFDVRASAAIALGKLGDARAVEPLREAARRDVRADVRRAAYLALGLLGRAEVLPFLCDAISDARLDLEERAMAALGLGLLGGDEAASFLVFHLDRRAAHPESKIAGEEQLTGTVYAALGLSGSIEALRPLWRTVDDETGDPFLRAHAVLSLGRLRDRDSVDRIVRLLAPSTDGTLRRCAVVALGRIARPEDGAAIRALSAILVTDRDPTMRRFAAMSLGGIRAPTVRTLLRGQFDACADVERPFFALALATQGDSTSCPAIREALRSAHDESARAAYCTALGLLADGDSAAALSEQIGPGPSPGTYRGFAALALAVIPVPASRDAIWKRLPEEHDARVWGDYAVALGMLGDTRVRAFLLNALRNGDGNFDRCRAASCLGVLRRADAVPELVDVLRNRRVDGIVRALCAVALGQIGDPSPVPKLSRLGAGGSASLATKALAEALTIL